MPAWRTREAARACCCSGRCATQASCRYLGGGGEPPVLLRSRAACRPLPLPHTHSLATLWDRCSASWSAATCSTPATRDEGVCACAAGACGLVQLKRCGCFVATCNSLLDPQATRSLQHKSAPDKTRVPSAVAASTNAMADALAPSNTIHSAPSHARLRPQRQHGMHPAPARTAPRSCAQGMGAPTAAPV